MSSQKKVPVTTTGKYNHLNEFDLPLTKQGTQHSSIQVGMAGLSIGSKGVSVGHHDAWVETDDIIDWSVFDRIDFPGHEDYFIQSLHYMGNDVTFTSWTSNRPIRFFHFKPVTDVVVDLTKAQIRVFELYVSDSLVDLSLGEKANYITIHGNLENVTFKHCPEEFSLSFKSFQNRKNKSLYQLPNFPVAKTAKSISIFGEVNGEPFDCESLLQFSNLKSLYLSDNVVNVSALAKLEQLEKIGLSLILKLDEMPNLATWKHLGDFFAENVEETVGKRLRDELKLLKKDREFPAHCTVLKLRKSIWFETEYNIPFSNWEATSAKVATKAYKNSLKEMRKAKVEIDVYHAIIKLITCINELADIDTSEREDVWTAVNQLVKVSALSICQKMLEQWFDETRDF